MASSLYVYVEKNGIGSAKASSCVDIYFNFVSKMIVICHKW